MVAANGFRAFRPHRVWAGILILFLLFVVMMGPAPAVAQELEGGCSVTASSGVDATTVRDATQDDPFEIDPAGRITWEATSQAPIRNHTWEIWIEVAGLQVTVASGGGPNDAGQQTQEGEADVALETREAAEDLGLPIDQLRGLFHVGGQIHGEGGSCSGNGYVLVRGGPFDGLAGWVALGLATLGGILFVWSGIKRPTTGS
jgi:hypothetical protein